MSTYNSPADVNPITRALSAIPNGIDAACATAFALIPDETLMKQGKVTYAVDSANVANAYTITLAVSPASYADGLLISCRPLVSNSGAATINVNGLGVKSIRNIDSTALSAGAIVAGSAFIIVYSTTTGYFHLLTSALYQQASGSFATLNGAETLANKVINSSTIGNTCTETIAGITYGSNVLPSNVVAKKLGSVVTLFGLVSYSGAGSVADILIMPAGYRPSSSVFFAARWRDSSVGLTAYQPLLLEINSSGSMGSEGFDMTGTAIATPASGDALWFSVTYTV